MVTLQRPEYVWFDGGIRSWDDAVFHVSSEALVRGLNVFEGLKGYHQPDGTFGIVAMRRHHDRLRRSARLLHIPFEETWEEFRDAHLQLVGRLLQPENEMWIRTTLYVEEGHWGLDTKSNLVLTAFQHPKGPPDPVRIGVSSWQRASDAALPCRIKTSSNYQVARLARVEGRPRGYSEMVLLNPAGRVAEATGACVVIVYRGVVVTPPPSEGRLESITLEIIEALAHSMGIPFEQRPIEHSELKLAEEVALVGTLAEMPQVTEVDGYEFPTFDVLGQLRDRFFAAVTGTDPHPAVDLTPVPVQDVPITTGSRTGPASPR